MGLSGCMDRLGRTEGWLLCLIAALQGRRMETSSGVPQILSEKLFIRGLLENYAVEYSHLGVDFGELWLVFGYAV